MENTLRVCNRCKETKPLSEYYVDMSKVHSKARTCKSCSKARQKKWQTDNRTKLNLSNAKHRWKSQGITLTSDQILKQFEKQNYACAICKDEISLEKYHYDHCHGTSTLREILCPPCNKGIGFFDDDPHLLQLAIDYLKRH